MKIKFLSPLFGVILLFHLVNSTHAQSNLPVVVSPPPEAAALGKFGDMPVSLYNGIPEISIPIYSIPVNGQFIPISLSYHAGGIKVGEIPSSTGLGWALNAGGVITRTVRGQDDPTGHGFRFSPPIPIGSGCLADHNALVYLQAAVGGTNDTEPDMFYFNFNGKTGKFVVDKSGNVHQMPYSNLKIIPTNSSWAGWQIITEDGVEYNFNVAETIEYTSVPVGTGNASFFANSYISSWYLSQIKYPNSSQTVTFDYTTDRITYDLPLSEERYDLSSRPAGSSTCPLIIGSNQSIIAHNSLHAYRLTKINFPNGSLEFLPGNYRKDYTNGRTLGQIKISNNNGLLKSFKFQYEYYSKPNSSSPIADDGTATSTTVANTTMRLHLASIQEYGSDGVTTKSPYLFTYNTSVILPDRVLSKAIDHWGYYNGQDANTTLIPTHNYQTTAGGNYTYIGGIREPSSQYAQANILTQITYPTGGTTQFAFESNQAANASTSSPGVPQTQLVTYKIGRCYLTTGASGNFTVDDVNGSATFNISLAPDGTDLSAFPLPSYTLTAKSCPTNTTGSIPSSAFNYIYFQILNVTDPLHPTVVFNQDGSQMYLAGSGVAGVKSIILPNGKYKLKGIKGNSNFSPSAPEITDYDGNFNELMTFQIKGTIYKAPSSGPVAATIGGVRIKQMTDYDPVSQKSITKTYDYTSNGQSSGVVNWMPVYSYTYNEDDYGCNNFHGFYSYDVYNASSVLPLTQMQGGNVGYSKVTVSNLDNQGQPGTNGKTEYYYTNPPDYYFGLFEAKSNFADPTGMSVCFVNKGSYITNLFKYPYAPPASPEWGKGLLTNQIDYIRNADNSYSKVKEIVNTYKADYFGATYDYNLSKDVIAAKIVVSTKMKNKDNVGNWDTYAIQYYYIPSRFSKLVGTTETLYDNSGTGITQRKEYAYDNLAHMQLTKSIDYKSDGSKVTTQNLYPLDYSNTTGFIADMKGANILNKPVESVAYSTDITGNTVSILKGSVTTYKQAPDLGLPSDVKMLEITQPLALNQFKFSNQSTAGVLPVTGTQSLFSTDTHYPGLANVNFSYNGFGGILQAQKRNDIYQSYIWDYNSTYPVAEVKNAGSGQIAYESFEADGTGNWNAYTGTITTPTVAPFPPTGKKYYNIAATATLSKSVTNGQKYIVSYWRNSSAGAYTVSGGTGTAKQGPTINGWTYYEHIVTATSTTLTITGTGGIDEVRLYPSMAQMTTYTYEPLVGMTSACDVNNRITYYEYDSFQRLLRVRDQDGKIVKQFDYQYQQ